MPTVPVSKVAEGPKLKMYLPKIHTEVQVQYFTRQMDINQTKLVIKTNVRHNLGIKH